AETSFCAHCGDICQVQHITYNHHNFCCEGCKTVFEILHNNNLCEYYELNSQVGIKIPKTNFGEKYGFLDVPEIGQKLLVFSSNTVSKAVFYVPNIHCSSCIWLLENLQKLNDGIL